MKLRKLLPIAFLAVAGLSACAQGDTNVYDVNIDNIEAMAAEWHVGDASRTLSVSATKNGEAVNATQLLNSEIFVKSSNEEVATTLGFVVTPVAAGDFTLTVTYHSVEMTLDLNIKPLRTCIDKYGTVHAGTEADPLDYADALTIGAAMKAAAKSTDEEDIYIKGVVKYWYHFPGERIGNDEATSWFIEGAGTETKAEELFEMYKITKEGGTSLTDADIWPGAEVLVKAQIGYYNSQLETTKGTFVRVTGGAARVAPETKEVGVSTKDTDALAVGKALQDGDTTWDKYEITGYTVNNLGTNRDGTFNYMIANSKTETNASYMFEIYSSSTELKYQAKVKVTCRIKNYHGTIETNMLENIEVIEAGTDWVEHAEPTVIENKGLADLFADESGNYKQAYKVTGTISKWIGTNTDATKYGNFYLTVEGDDTEYYIYGATATASALSWGKYANKYSFVNPQDFLTNSATKNIAIGTVVTMKLVRCDYTKNDVTTKEATGIVLDTNLDNRTFEKLEKFTFHSDLTAYTGYDAEQFEAFIKAASEKGAETNFVSHSLGANCATNPLIGAYGGSDPNKWSNYNLLKLGSTTKNSDLVLTFKEGLKIGKVVVKAEGWVGKNCALAINDSKVTTIASPANAATFKAALEAGTAFQTEYTFTFTESNVVELVSTLCVMITEITFYTVVEAAA